VGSPWANVGGAAEQARAKPDEILRSVNEDTDWLYAWTKSVLIEFACTTPGAGRGDLGAGPHHWGVSVFCIATIFHWVPCLIQVLRSAGFEVEHLITEGVGGAQHATWVLDILKANGFETSLRGEQICCPARKKQPAASDRFPAFLYNS
jgi:hypothetical protein